MTTQIYFPTLENGPISWNWLKLAGPDAKDFLQRLTTVNLHRMDQGNGAPGCFLTAQGKIRSYFYLWNPRKDEYIFEFDAGSSGKWKTDLLSIIDQYTFGEKFTLEDLSPPLKCAWIFPDEAQLNRLSEARTAGQIVEAGVNDGTNPEIKICNHGTLNYGRAWLTVWGMPMLLKDWISKNFPNQESDLNTLSFAEIEKWRIQAVQPRVDSEITEAAVPLEIGLRTAIADNKGCYPGQEVIEKIVALGSPAKRLVRIEGVGIPPQVGDRVQAIDPSTQQAGAEIGTITTSVEKKAVSSDKQASEKEFAALALIRKTHAKEGLDVGFQNHPQMRGTVVKIAPHA